MADRAALQATGLPARIPVTFKDATGARARVWATTDGGREFHGPITTDSAGATQPVVYAENGTYTAVYTGGTASVVVSTADVNAAPTMPTTAYGGGGGGGITAGTVSGQIPVWDGDSYEPQTPTAVTATDIPFTPTGTVAATNVQAAIAEVASETGGGSSLTVQEEGASLATAATTLNFEGAGVTATGTGATKTITIPGGGGAAPESASSYVVTSETTASATYISLTTPQAVTITVPASGRVRIDLGSFVSNSQANNFSLVSVALSGANTLASGTGQAPILQAGNLPATAGADLAKSVVLTGLTAGSTTFTMQFRVTGAAQSTFAYRSLIVTAA